jgi:predicted transcriptional regulator
MTLRTLTHGDPEQMAAATVNTSPTPESERQAYAPAMRTLLAALAEGRPATVAELAGPPGRDPGEVADRLRAWPDVE